MMQEVWTDHGIYVLNRVFIRGIPNTMTELQLEILFGEMGYEVQNVRIVEDIRTGASKGYGFVTFRTAEEARKVQEMRLVEWNGKALQVDVAVKRKTMARLLSQYIPPVQHSLLGYTMPQEMPVPAVVSWQEGNLLWQGFNHCQATPMDDCWMQSR
ncbi:unnamed protein product [Porites lobata]|uniref:RRM domain-containing protein n=1 Tax=Porites lobata TaxID=104759 RepID=A0ABN8QSF8_9CNID|nr:unnamed protein product [Porites lobata]